MSTSVKQTIIISFLTEVDIECKTGQKIRSMYFSFYNCKQKLSINLNAQYLRCSTVPMLKKETANKRNEKFLIYILNLNHKNRLNLF